MTRKSVRTVFATGGICKKGESAPPSLNRRFEGKNQMRLWSCGRRRRRKAEEGGGGRPGAATVAGASQFCYYMDQIYGFWAFVGFSCSVPNDKPNFFNGWTQAMLWACLAQFWPEIQMWENGQYKKFYNGISERVFLFSRKKRNLGEKNIIVLVR